MRVGVLGFPLHRPTTRGLEIQNKEYAIGERTLYRLSGLRFRSQDLGCARFIAYSLEDVAFRV